jgi:hypothetical protein
MNSAAAMAPGGRAARFDSSCTDGGRHFRARADLLQCRRTFTEL